MDQTISNQGHVSVCTMKSGSGGDGEKSIFRTAGARRFFCLPSSFLFLAPPRGRKKALRRLKLETGEKKIGKVPRQNQNGDQS